MMAHLNSFGPLASLTPLFDFGRLVKLFVFDCYYYL